jgi:ubiquinone/menaquinone biosynthesis C-methylase UbiE
MYICPKCHHKFQLPKCQFCENKVEQINEIYQLTLDPNTNLNINTDMYIGFDEIGVYYSGEEFYHINPETEVIVDEIDKLINNGLFLDLGCGDGFFTVPLAKRKKKIIAGDISNNMLSLLIKKAKINNISLETVDIIRMNALNIPIFDNSVDVILANNLLHLISNPQKVLNEIYRILKKEGIFIILSDSPNKSIDTNFSEEEIYMKYVNECYNRYWDLLKAKNIYQKKYNSHFNQYQACNSLFKEMRTIYTKPVDISGYITLKNDFLYRLMGKSFFDQTDVPNILHQDTYNQVQKEFNQKYGEKFIEIGYHFHGIDCNIIDIFRK